MTAPLRFEPEYETIERLTAERDALRAQLDEARAEIITNNAKWDEISARDSADYIQVCAERDEARERLDIASHNARHFSDEVVKLEAQLAGMTAQRDGASRAVSMAMDEMRDAIAERDAAIDELTTRRENFDLMSKRLIECEHERDALTAENARLREVLVKIRDIDLSLARAEITANAALDGAK